VELTELRDISQGEKVEQELDAFVNKRDRQRRESEGERAAEEMYRESCRRHEEQRRAVLRAEWVAYHKAAAERARRTLGRIVEEHEAAASRLEGLKETA
jgi:hypothetical protein